MRQLFLFSICLIFFSLLLEPPNTLKPLSQSLQEKCAARFSEQEQVSTEMNAALACGVELPRSSPYRALLIQTGLYHLIVVSGSHLLLLGLLIEGWPRWVLPLAGLALLMCTGLQPPLVRGFLQWALISKLSSAPLVLASYFFSLLLFPEWKDSFSLHLSTAAALGLTLKCPSAWQRSDFGFLWSYLTPWIYAAPLLVGLNTLHPSQLISNLFFASTATFVLIPVSYVQLLAPELPLNGIYELFFQTLASFSFEVPPANRSGQAFQIKGPLLAIYLFGLTAFTQAWNVWWLRRTLRSMS